MNCRRPPEDSAHFPTLRYLFLSANSLKDLKEAGPLAPANYRASDPSASNLKSATSDVISPAPLNGSLSGSASVHFGCLGQLSSYFTYSKMYKERRQRSSSISSLTNKNCRKSISLDRNNNNIRLDRQKRIIHNTSKHVNEGFFGASENIRAISSREDVEKFYEIGSPIGQGTFSRVYFAKKRIDEKKCALKEIEKHSLRGKWFFIENEVEIMRMCNHRNICKIADAFKTKNNYYLLVDYAQSGDLFEAIRLRGKLTEPDAANVLQQVASALTYLHILKIVHRDIKPENILLNPNLTVKLCDFGLACTVLGPLFRVCGTPTYCAPEILKETGYGISVDVWSLGILLHVMLVGYAPFRSSDRNRLFALIIRAKLQFDLPEWKAIGTRARDLVSRMISLNVERRPKAHEIKLHSWISHYNSSTDSDE